MFTNLTKGIFAFAALICLVGGPARGHPVDTPPGHTGGFGEPTCVECHASYPLNPPEGVLRLASESKTFRPGGHYKILLELTDPYMRRAGFELSVRYSSGEHRGEDAGGLHYPASDAATPDDLRISQGKGHSYLVHESGGRLVHKSDVTTWQINWVAPGSESPQCAIVFHAVANASDDDESPLGDRIYATQLTLRPDSEDAGCHSVAN